LTYEGGKKSAGQIELGFGHTETIYVYDETKISQGPTKPTIQEGISVKPIRVDMDLVFPPNNINIGFEGKTKIQDDDKKSSSSSSSKKDSSEDEREEIRIEKIRRDTYSWKKKKDEKYQYETDGLIKEQKGSIKLEVKCPKCHCTFDHFVVEGL